MTILTLGRQETTLDYDADFISYDCEIDGHFLTFEGYLGSDGKYMDLLFTVDGTLERVDLSKTTKSAISRWLLACWFDCKTKYDSFSCCACDHDGTGWRETMYRKLGFVGDGNAMRYN